MSDVSRAMSRPLPPHLEGLTPEQVELLRNEVEIAIYHVKDKLNDVTVWILVICALEAGEGLLRHDVASTASPALVALLTSEVRATASVPAGVAYCVLGVLSVFDYPRALFPGHGAEPPSLTWRLILFFGGALLLGVSLYLRRLLHFRATIPLPHAEHLNEGARTFQPGVE